jgi:hypothetical protein
MTGSGFASEGEGGTGQTEIELFETVKQFNPKRILKSLQTYMCLDINNIE